MPDGAKIVKKEDCYKTNPEMVFRKEEEGAFLFDPRTGNLKYLNATGVIVYELCDGVNTVKDIHMLIAKLYPEIETEKLATDTELFFENLLSMHFIKINEI
jgi:hypothetical protein